VSLEGRVQNLGGTAPLKFEKAINVHNSARFRTTFDFDGKYLSDELRYRQAFNGIINYHFFCVEQKKLYERSINNKVVFAHFDLPNIDSSLVFGQL